MFSLKGLWPLVLAGLVTVSGSSLRLDGESVQWVGKLVVERSGARLAFVLVDKHGIRRQIQIPAQTLATHNGVGALENSWMIVDARIGGAFPVVKALSPILPDLYQRTHDPILLGKLPDSGILGLNRPSYKGPVTNVYEAIRANRISRRSIAGVTKGGTVELGQQALVARFYVDGDARHYFLLSPAGLSSPGADGVFLDEVREDNFTPAGDRSGCVLANDFHRIQNPYGGKAGVAGQSYKTSAGGIVQIQQSSPGRATVSIHPLGIHPTAVLAQNLVLNTNDTGAGSLRNAITYCNANPAAFTSIDFAIPTSDAGYDGKYVTIKTVGSLPDISEAGLTVAGATQTAYSGDSNSFGPEVLIQGPGDLDLNAIAFKIAAQGVTIDHLAIGGFLGRGIQANGANTTVRSCNVGIDPTGITAIPNLVGILFQSADNSKIEASPGEYTVVAGNTVDGIDVLNCDNCSIQASFVGIGNYYSTAVSNGRSGIRVISCTNLKIGSAASGLGNVISGNSTEDGIHCENVTGLTILGNVVGANQYAYSAVPNLNGINLQGCDQVKVGGSAQGERNVISGNANYGILVAPASSQNPPLMHVSVLGNLIGLSRKGDFPLGNGTGVYVGGQASTVIGNATTAGRNIISGNLLGFDDISTGVTTVQGNYIGTDILGKQAVPNREGVQLEGRGTQCLFGGRTSGQANVVSGNNGPGIVLFGKNTRVEGNIVGLNAAGKAQIPNHDGIWAEGSLSKVTIGAAASGAANVVCGNANDGVQLLFSSGAVIQGNLIGILANGTPIGNGGNGIHFVGQSSSTTIGGTAANQGNVISGNGLAGIYLDGTPAVPGISVPHPHVLAVPNANTIVGNVIGLNKAGTLAVPNQIGISIRLGCHHNIIGGTIAGAGNTISGNTSFGILLSDASTSYNGVQGNTVSANGGFGIAIGGGAKLNQVGTTKPNTISSNKGAGVRLNGAGTGQNLVESNAIQNNLGGQILMDGGASGNTAVHNALVASAGPAAIVVKDTTSSGNNLRGNTYNVGNRLLVDLIGLDGPFGVTPNDTKDLDKGPNTLQNNANINTATMTSGTMALTGTLGSTPNSTFSVDIYLVDAENSAKHGGNVRFLTTFSVKTNASGLVTFSKSLAVTGSPIGVCTQVTSTGGSTSEFGGNRLF